MAPIGPPSITVTLRGTADVDQQGRLRRLTGLETYRVSHVPYVPRSYGPIVSSISVTFSGFGQPIPASIPPASQVIVRPHS